MWRIYLTTNDFLDGGDYCNTIDSTLGSFSFAVFGYVTLVAPTISPTTADYVSPSFRPARPSFFSPPKLSLKPSNRPSRSPSLFASGSPSIDISVLNVVPSQVSSLGSSLSPTRHQGTLPLLEWSLRFSDESTKRALLAGFLSGSFRYDFSTNPRNRFYLAN
jgi:hypothetical protein